MGPPLTLDVGVQIRCPHCRRWHILEVAVRPTEHAFARDMLYFTCGDRKRPGVYYAGQRGGAARYPTRAATS